MQDQLGRPLLQRRVIPQADPCVLAKLCQFSSNKTDLRTSYCQGTGSVELGRMAASSPGGSLAVRSARPAPGSLQKGVFFGTKLPKNVKCEGCAEVCRLALSARDWSVLGADIPREVSLHRLPLLISPRDRDDSLSISLRRSSFVCETNRRCRRMYYFSANILYINLKFLTGLPK